MWTRKELKKSAKTSLRKNYLACISACFLVIVFTGIVSLAGSGAVSTDFSPHSNVQGTNAGILVDFFENLNVSGFQALVNAAPASLVGEKGLLSSVFSNSTRSGSFLFGVLNTVNQSLFNNSIASSIIVGTGTVLMLLYWSVVGNFLMVGQCRFFLENKNYIKTPTSRIVFAFKIRRMSKVAKAMCLRMLSCALWSLTIVGGFVETYATLMVPCILAENPDIPAKTAMRLSRSMMKGHKWRSFLLDMSFLPWTLLSIFTLGFLNDLFLAPYQGATKAELYFCLREKALAENQAGTEYLNDNLLISPPPNTPSYPVKDYSIPEHARRQWLTRPYTRSYSPINIVLLFFSFSMVGFVWEMFYEFFLNGAVEKRGTLMGPWLPIYGVGGVIAILLLKRWAEKPPVLFGMAVVIFGVLEYFTGWILEAIYQMRWWNYDGYFLNIHGRICLEGLLFFAMGASLGVYILGPMLDDAFNRISVRTRWLICVPLLALFLADVTFSMFNPNISGSVPLSGEDALGSLPPQSSAHALPKQGTYPRVT